MANVQLRPVTGRNDGLRTLETHRTRLALSRPARVALEVAALTLALGVALLARASAFDTYRVVSDSMAPCLLAGDHVLVDKVAFGTRLPLIGISLPPLRAPRAGDVLLFRHPDAPDEIHVKRCAAGPGGYAALPRGAIAVPDGMFFVLGDNERHSSDSREWGFLPLDHIIGRAARVVWSRSPEGVRWSRLWHGVR